MKKPIIGITCDFYEEKSKKKRVKPRQVYSLGRSYVRAVIEAGGIPILLGGAANQKDIFRQLKMLDGLLLTGGRDHNPKIYGAKKHPKTHILHTVRQEYEIAIAKVAIKTDLPILGICLGCQTINVVNGGTLIQDISSTINTKITHSQKESRNTLTHNVTIDKNSRLFQILKKKKIKSNSFHHQAVKKVAPNFKITAKADDGIIEAIEYTKNRFILGIQWHPEGLIQYSDHLKLFKALVDEARK